MLSGARRLSSSVTNVNRLAHAQIKIDPILFPVQRWDRPRKSNWCDVNGQGSAVCLGFVGPLYTF